MTTPLIITLAALGLLQIADIVLTLKGLKMGLSEANPFASRMFRLLGPTVAAIMLKLVASAGFVAFVLFYPTWWPALALFDVSMVVIVVLNARTIQRARKE